MTTTRLARPLLCLLAAGLLSACAIRAEAPSLFDLGPVHAQQAGPAPAPVVLADVQAPLWLDSQAMFYRLAHVNQQQARAYAHSRWTMPPAGLVTQRLKARLSLAGGIVASPGDGTASMPLMRLELDDFTQVFASDTVSEGRVSLRASLFRGRALLSQKTFTRAVPAASADAAGGAAALSAATDAALGDLLQWLASQPAGQ